MLLIKGGGAGPPKAQRGTLAQHNWLAYALPGKGGFQAKGGTLAQPSLGPKPFWKLQHNFFSFSSAARGGGCRP